MDRSNWDDVGAPPLTYREQLAARAAWRAVILRAEGATTQEAAQIIAMEFPELEPRIRHLLPKREATGGSAVE